MKIETIVLTTDFSEAARKAYPAAVALAKAFEATIHLAHVAESMPPYFFLHGMGIDTEVPHEPYLLELERRLEEEEARREIFEGCRIQPKLLYHGYPEEALGHYTHEVGADLVIVATHGHSGLGYFFLGSFTQKLVRHSPAPVLTYRVGDEAGQALGFKHVVVPFDFSENSTVVVPAVRFLSENFGSKFTFLYSVEPVPQFVEMPTEAVFSTYFFRALEEAPDRARDHFAEIRKKHLEGIDADLEVCHGIPHKEILQFVKKTSADLVLMATHGWTGLKHYLLGSVAEKVLHKASCSVLTVRPEHPEKPPSEGKDTTQKAP